MRFDRKKNRAKRQCYKERKILLLEKSYLEIVMNFQRPQRSQHRARDQQSAQQFCRRARKRAKTVRRCGEFIAHLKKPKRSKRSIALLRSSRSKCSGGVKFVRLNKTEPRG